MHSKAAPERYKTGLRGRRFQRLVECDDFAEGGKLLVQCLRPASGQNFLQPSEELAWYALRTRAKHEQTVAAILDSKGYEQFLPIYRARRRWSDRVVESEQPLFAGYLFCRFDVQHRLPIVVTPGVAYIVSIGKEPAAISNSEIDSVRTVLKAGVTIAPYPFLTEGQRVRINLGSLEGVEGILLKYRNDWSIVISVTLLQRSILVEIDRECVSPI